MRGTEFDASVTAVVYEANGVTITAFPVIHNLHGAVGYRVDFAGLSMVFSGDTHPCWPLVRAAEGTDLLIHECFPSADVLAALTGDRIERFETITATHTVPKGAGKVFSLTKPRMAGLWHTFLVPACGRADPRAGGHRLRRSRGPDPGPHGVQHHQGGRRRAPDRGGPAGRRRPRRTELRADTRPTADAAELVGGSVHPRRAMSQTRSPPAAGSRGRRRNRRSSLR